MSEFVGLGQITSRPGLLVTRHQETSFRPLNEQEWRATLEELADDRRLLAILIVAHGAEDGPRVELAEGEMDMLVRGVFQAMKRSHGQRKRLLNSVMDKLHVPLHESDVVH